MVDYNQTTHCCETFAALQQNVFLKAAIFQFKMCVSRLCFDHMHFHKFYKVETVNFFHEITIFVIQKLKLEKDLFIERFEMCFFKV